MRTRQGESARRKTSRTKPDIVFTQPPNVAGGARGIFVLLSACLVLSGAASLALEVVWMRELRLALGSTTLASSSIFFAYMLGLGGGAWLGGRLAARVQRPVRLYGLLELTIGVCAFFVPWMCRTVVAELNQWIASLDFWSATCARFAVSQLVLLPPTLAMGATLPVVVSATDGRGAAVGPATSVLYGANTIGAVAGVFGASFALLPRLGLSGTNLVAALADISIGAAVLVWDRAQVAGNLAQRGDAIAPAPVRGFRLQEGRSVWVPLAAYGVIGFVALAYEVCWTRALASVFGSSSYAFASMLGSFLVGIALGSLAVRRWLERMHAPEFATALVVLGLSGASLVTFQVLFVLPDWFPWLFLYFGADYPAAVWASIVLTGFALLPPTLLFGALFPLLVTLVARSGGRHGARAVSYAYLSNTLGSAAGAFAAGFLMLPLFGLETSLRGLATVIIGVAVVFALWQRERAGVARTVLLGLAGMLVVLVWGVLPGARPEALARGVFRFPIAELDVGVAPVALRGPLEGELLLYRDGWNATVSVHRILGELSLRVNGKADASTHGDLGTQVLLGHLGYFFRPEAREVAVVGLASGITAGSATLHRAERIDVIEIEPAMKEACRFFERVNNRPLEHPAVHLILDDARTVLASKTQAYDLIISEPSNPWMSGSANLFTREFFVAVRRALRPHGLLVQWLQLYAMPEPAVAAVLRAVSDAFPYVYGFAPGHGDTDFILVAGNEPIRAAHFPQWEALPSAARADLVRVGLFDADDVRALLYLSPNGVRALAAKAPTINSDDNMFVELLGPQALYDQPTNETNWALVDTQAEETAAYWRDLAETGGAAPLAELALAYLRRNGRALAEALLPEIERAGNTPLASAIRAQMEFEQRQSDADALEQLTRTLREVVSRAPTSYSARYLLANAEYDRQEPLRALEQIEVGLQQRPGDIRLRRLRLRTLLALGRFQEAWDEAEPLLTTALRQRDTDLYWDAAQAAWRAGRLREASQWIETYLDSHPDSPEQWEALAEIRTQLGEHADAERARTNAAQAKRNFILALHMQARRAAVAGVRDEALNQLRTIVLLDPSYLPARQDLERLQRGQALKF